MVDINETDLDASSNGEDRYDAVVGLYGMIHIVLGNRSTCNPIVSAIRNIGGWLIGQEIPQGVSLA